MPTEKPRISTYVPEELRKCFKIISAVNGLTESKMLEKLVIECVRDNSELLQKLNVKTYLLHRNRKPAPRFFSVGAGFWTFGVSSSVFRHSFFGRSPRKKSAYPIALSLIRLRSCSALR